MKALSIIILSLCAWHAHANATCVSNDSPIYTEYRQVINHIDTPAFDFYRLSTNEVLYDYLDKHMAKSWFHTKNNQVKTAHLFHDYQRSIEYEAGDLSGDLQTVWKTKSSILSKKFLAKLNPSKTDKPCETAYQGNVQGTDWHIVWSDTLNLPLEITQMKNGHTQTTKMQHYSYDLAKINAMKTRLENYQSTDYADVGDNESDPFLRKMIRLGFVKHGSSGFYDSQGNQQSAHAH